MLTCEKVVAWRTSDGAFHSTPEMARQYIANAVLVDLLVRDDRNAHDAQDIINEISGHRKQLREWLDSCDALEREIIA